MPNLLRKKRRSSSTSTIAVEDGPDHRPMEAPPSPASSKTAFSRRSSKGSLNSPAKHDSDAGSSPSRLKVLKLSPMKALVAKKVKRQIQRLDDAIHHVTLPRSTSGGKVGKEEDEEEDAERAEPRRRVTSLKRLRDSLPSPSSLSILPRKRTLSTRVEPPQQADKQLPQRSRTVSCPAVSALVMSSTPILLPVQEEATVGKPEGLESQDDSVFGGTVPVPEVHVEEDVPDPFLVDDEGDALSSEDGSGPAEAPRESESASPAAAQEVSLSNTNTASPSPLPAPPSSLPMTPNVNKDVPPPPISDSDDDEDDIPDLYLPGLVIPTMFLPIPNTDPLTILLNKYIYPPESRPHRDVTGDWQHSDFHTLVMTNSWRALAKMARDRIVSSDPADLNLILGLWHLRLSCLARLRLFNQTAAECTNLFSVLNSFDPPESRAYLFERILPFELEVMQTRLKYWAGDHMGYLDALAALLRKCKVNAKQGKTDGSVMSMWKERGARVALIIATQMAEMKEFTAAARLLEPICAQADGVTNPALRSAVARIYLQGGNLEMAAKHFAEAEADSTADPRQKQMNSALLASAEGNWKESNELLRGMIDKDNEDYVAVNNLAVALLNQGKMQEAIEVLESALKASPSSVVVAEPFLFNLSTLYELRSNIGFESKRQLLVEVSKWSGDGLKATCLKLPTN